MQADEDDKLSEEELLGQVTCVVTLNSIMKPLFMLVVALWTGR